MISANDPFFGAFVGPPSVGGGVGWPFLNVDDAVGVRVRPLGPSFIFDIEVSTPEGLLLRFMGREEFAVAREPVGVRWSLSVGRRSGSLSDALRFGGMGMLACVGLGSPVIWARRSPILVILSVFFLGDEVEDDKGTVPAWLWRVCGRRGGGRRVTINTVLRCLSRALVGSEGASENRTSV